MAGRRKIYDWGTIHREYRTNQFTDAELARRHGCSRAAISQRAAKHGWTRDLEEAVRQAANAKLIKEDAKVASVLTDNLHQLTVSEVELASETRVAVLRAHRKDITTMRELETQLLAELADRPTKLYMAQYQGQVIETVVGIPVTEKSLALSSLASVQQRRIQLERQAFGIDDKSSSEGDEVGEIIFRVVKS